MENNMKTFDLSDEQLATVVGGYGFSKQDNVSFIWQYAQTNAAVVNVADPYFAKNSFNNNQAQAAAINTAFVSQENQKN